MKISCPMCSHPLQNPGAVEEVSVEYTALSICGRCGFGLNLRWRGRGSALAKPLPNLIVVTQYPTLVEHLNNALPDGIKVEGVPTSFEALGIYARALRLGRPIYAVLLTHKSEDLLWSEVALSLRSLEEGFEIPHPSPLWFFTSEALDGREAEEFRDLSEIYWRPCAAGTEHEVLLESIPPLFSGI
jgi:hypothetical protein